MKVELHITQKETIARLGTGGIKQIFEQFRLDLQGRILGVQDVDLIKLQGKIEFCNELENFFLGLLK